MNGKIQVNSGDISIIAVNIDGVASDKIPTKEDGKYFESAECSNGATGAWDRSNWRFLISNLTEKKTKCTLNFVSQNNIKEQSSENKMEDLLEQEKTKSNPKITSDDNNIRYIGSNPANYVYFNCTEGTEQNDQNCEKWRIIGLMDNIQTKEGKTERLLKIIREPFRKIVDGKETGDVFLLSWDSSPEEINDGDGVNEWSQADIQKVLNTDYYNGVNGNEKCYGYWHEATTSCPDWTLVG